MTRPKTLTLIAGHPIIGVPLILFDVYAGYVFTMANGFGWPDRHRLVLRGVDRQQRQTGDTLPRLAARMG